MDPLHAQLYGLLVVQGVFWILGHCPGMCGPLVVAMRFPGVRGLLAYQAGKACTYALLGALAGGLGGLTILALRERAPLLLGFTALLMAAAGAAGLLRQARGGQGIGGIRAPAWLARAVHRRAARQGAGAKPGAALFGAALVGALLALLPCAVVVWVLGLAVASASPLHGALLLVGLVLLNTPVLLAAQLLGGSLWLAGLRRRLAWLPPLGLLLAGLWLGRLVLLSGDTLCRTAGHA